MANGAGAWTTGKKGFPGRTVRSAGDLRVRAGTPKKCSAIPGKHERGRGMKQEEDQPSAAKHDDYWALARQPLHCLLFLLPLLVTYEIGVGLVSVGAHETVRNGADHWMRTGLRLAGFEHPLLLPLVVVGLLAGWQLIGHFRWKPSAPT